MIRVIAVTVALMLIVACGKGPATDDDPIRSDSAGVEIVLSTDDHRSIGWRMVEELSIGGRDEGPEAFYQVAARGVDVAPDGRIFVLDASNHRVALFGSDGSALGTVGQQGGGPGELQRPAALRVEDDQAVAVFDIGKQALVRFRPDGSSIGDQALDVLRVGTEWHPSPRGTYWTLREPASDGAELVSLVQVSPEGDTVALVQHRTAARAPVELTSCGLRIAVGPVFEARMHWDAVHTDLAVSPGAEYVVDLFRGTEHVRSVRRSIEPLTGTEALALEELGEGSVIQSSAGPHVCDPQEELAKRGYSDVVPAIDDVALAPDGTLWVERAAVGEDVGSVDVFNSAGGYVGSFTSGTPFPIGFLPDGRPLVITADEFDVERLSVMRLER